VSQDQGEEGEGLWAGLRQRKVVQWGIAYVAAEWGLLQGVGYLGTAVPVRRSEQLQRIAIVAFIVGLPIALVVAWYHGDRGHQRVSGRELTILTALLRIGGGLFGWVGRMPETPTATDATPSAARDPAATVAGPSIAVLRFVNMSDDKGTEYFADGISEELLNVLVRVDGLGVASRTSSFGYKGSPLGTAAIARALKVDHILESSVRNRQSRAHGCREDLPVAGRLRSGREPRRSPAGPVDAVGARLPGSSQLAGIQTRAGAHRRAGLLAQSRLLSAKPSDRQGRLHL